MSDSQTESLVYTANIWDWCPDWMVDANIGEIEAGNARIVGEPGDEQIVVDIEVTTR